LALSPGRAWERTEVGPPRPEIDRGRPPGRRGGTGGLGTTGRSSDVGHERAGPGQTDQPSLRDELGERLHDRPAGQAEVGGETARSGQPGAGGESPGPHRVAQCGLERPADPVAAREVEVQVQTA
jgi:hypothetical protein